MGNFIVDGRKVFFPKVVVGGPQTTVDWATYSGTVSPVTYLGTGSGNVLEDVKFAEYNSTTYLYVFTEVSSAPRTIRIGAVSVGGSPLIQQIGSFYTISVPAGSGVPREFYRIGDTDSYVLVYDVVGSRALRIINFDGTTITENSAVAAAPPTFASTPFTDGFYQMVRPVEYESTSPPATVLDNIFLGKMTSGTFNDLLFTSTQSVQFPNGDPSSDTASVTGSSGTSGRDYYLTAVLDANWKGGSAIRLNEDYLVASAVPAGGQDPRYILIDTSSTSPTTSPYTQADILTLNFRTAGVGNEAYISTVGDTDYIAQFITEINASAVNIGVRANLIAVDKTAGTLSGDSNTIAFTTLGGFTSNTPRYYGPIATNKENQVVALLRDSDETNNDITVAVFDVDTSNVELTYNTHLEVTPSFNSALQFGSFQGDFTDRDNSFLVREYESGKMVLLAATGNTSQRYNIGACVFEV